MTGCKIPEENAADLAREDLAKKDAECDSRRSLMITDRERDTIIAALRLWQHVGNKGRLPAVMQMQEIMGIADNDRTGPDAHIWPDEIDELIEERING